MVEGTPPRPELPEAVQKYAEWHKEAYGWNPFEPITCVWCKKPLPIMLAYRCYDCHAACHQNCLKQHYKESRQLRNWGRTDADVHYWAIHLCDEEKALIRNLLAESSAK